MSLGGLDKQSLSLQNTCDNVVIFVHSIWAFFRYIQLYYIANSLDVDSSSTHSNGTKWQPSMKGEGISLSKDADIGYTMMPLVVSGPYKGIHLRTHPGTHIDTQYWWLQECEDIGPVLRYNISWSSSKLSLFTIPADVGARQEQEVTFLAVAANLLLIDVANEFQNLRPKEQFEFGQPLRLPGSCLLLNSSNTQPEDGYRHKWAFLIVWLQWSQGNDLATKLPAVQDR